MCDWPHYASLVMGISGGLDGRLLSEDAQVKEKRRCAKGGRQRLRATTRQSGSTAGSGRRTSRHSSRSSGARWRSAGSNTATVLGWALQMVPAAWRVEWKLSGSAICFRVSQIIGLAGHQLPGLQRQYDHVWVIVEGLWRSADDGSIIEYVKGNGEPCTPLSPTEGRSGS